jgi:hypothetical protein
MGFTDNNREYNNQLSLDDVPCDIKIGGSSPDKFDPKISASKWGGEFWMDIQHSDVMDKAETLRDDRIELVVGDRTHRYYTTPEGNLEYDIVIDKKPLTNTIELDLNLSDGLRMIKQKSLYDDWFAIDETLRANGQPTIPWADFEQDNNRPDNIVGSYMIYTNKKHNDYKAGKFGIIEAPYLIGANQQKVKATQEYFGGKLIITMPWDFLNSAVYPIVLDPTLGYTTIGSSNTGSNTIKWGSDALSPASSGDTQTWHVAIAAVDGTDPGIKLGLYNTSGGNPNGQSLIEQVEFDVSVSNDESTAASGQSIAASTLYHLCIISENGNTKVKYDSGSSGDGTFKPGLTYATEMISPYDATGSNVDRLFSIWMDYGAAAGNLLISNPDIHGNIGRLRGHMQ